MEEESVMEGKGAEGLMVAMCGRGVKEEEEREPAVEEEEEVEEEEKWRRMKRNGGRGGSGDVEKAMR